MKAEVDEYHVHILPSAIESERRDRPETLCHPIDAPEEDFALPEGFCVALVCVAVLLSVAIAALVWAFRLL